MKTNSVILTRAEELVVALTLVIAGEIAMRSKTVQEVPEASQISSCGIITTFGEELQILDRLTGELAVVRARRKESNVDGDTKRLVRFFLDPSEWDWLKRSNFMDLNTRLGEIVGSLPAKPDRGETINTRRRDAIVLSTLGLPNRIVNALALSEIVCVGQFRKKTHRELRLGLGCSEPGLNMVRRKLETLGVDFSHWV